ncbi:hypothetical protein EST38_g3128 [Candolleomyces aberdarensis]|uniref:Nephrocystin 3-like N-terminal domain-containing protein n=1 Tax=Candolleomyces aberdarensis TaxID=2316362 RepID=A0A4Q2DSU8_9AGAR|nr:hypothetical protein EST38_g3128 [Candolleomyces aberdarensis]
MAGIPPSILIYPDARDFRIQQQNIYVATGSQYFSNGGQDLILRLNPIPDASHSRNRKTSPPDSECFPGTREEVVQDITTWADAMESTPATEEGVIETTSVAMVVYTPTPHIYWLHGFAGSGKSAISLKIANVFEESGRLLASYFFFRNAGDRCTLNRFAATLSSQLASALPATVPLLDAALRTDPGLLNNCVSLTRQMERLVYEPLRAIMRGDILEEARAKGPYIIVIDGLDECEDKQGVEELIDQMLDFFERHPTIPLRVFIASRVEQHIRARLEVDGVRLSDLNSYRTQGDINRFLQASFKAVAKRDRVIRAYIQAHGEWPTKSDMYHLGEHIGESFVLASLIFKFIVHPAITNDPSTPMERLPRTLQMNGLDSLYIQTLSRSQHLPHFRNIISTIALLREPLPIAGISSLLGIEAFEVVRVLLNLQAIIHVPGTDQEGSVTLCHTSVRDFLTTEGRSGSFFVPPSFHLHLSYHLISSIFEKLGVAGLTRNYDIWYLKHHWQEAFAQSYPCTSTNEQLKAPHSLHANRLPYCAFLCDMFLYSLFLHNPQITGDSPCLLTECSKQLALVAECPDPRIGLWLETTMDIYLMHGGIQTGTVQFTECMCQTVQHDLRRASTAIYAKFPNILDGLYRSTTQEDRPSFHLNLPGISGIDIFSALEWIVARAQHKWEEAKAALRPPLELGISQSYLGLMAIFSFDKI